jgi:hypothetical protein
MKEKLSKRHWELVKRGIVIAPINTKETYYKPGTALKCR